MPIYNIGVVRSTAWLKVPEREHLLKLPAKETDKLPDQELYDGFPDGSRLSSRSGMKTIEDASALGEAIRQQRRRLKVTQKDLAMASGSGLRFIVDLEKGKPTCQLGKALEIVRVLGLKLEIHGS